MSELSQDRPGQRSIARNQALSADNSDTLLQDGASDALRNALNPRKAPAETTLRFTTMKEAANDFLAHPTGKI